MLCAPFLDSVARLKKTKPLRPRFNLSSAGRYCATFSTPYRPSLDLAVGVEVGGGLLALASTLSATTTSFGGSGFCCARRAVTSGTRRGTTFPVALGLTESGREVAQGNLKPAWEFHSLRQLPRIEATSLDAEPRRSKELNRHSPVVPTDSLTRDNGILPPTIQEPVWTIELLLAVKPACPWDKPRNKTLEILKRDLENGPDGPKLFPIGHNLRVNAEIKTFRACGLYGHKPRVGNRQELGKRQAWPRSRLTKTRRKLRRAGCKHNHVHGFLQCYQVYFPP